MPSMMKRRLTPSFLFAALLAFACVLAAGPQSAVAQEQTVSGTVTAAGDGAPLPGVSVVVPGTQIGTATDAEGQYELGVPTGADSLEFSFVGFETETVAINGRSTIDVELVIETERLEEAVVIAYGAESRELLTESVGTVEAEQITEVPITSPEQALQGRVSGVQLTTTSAAPGAPSSVRIRGVGTVANAQPLYVIDGVPVGKSATTLIPGGKASNPLSTISPQDIASISVLKGPAAAAQYGVRAANGVVLIETKSGEAGDPSVSFNSYYGIQRQTDLHEFNSTREHIALRREADENYNRQFNLTPDSSGYQIVDPALQCPGGGYGCSLDEQIQGSDLLQRDNSEQYHDAALNQNAPKQSYNLSVSGGTEDLSYYFSGGYFDSQSNIVKESLERLSLRINSDYDVTDWLRIGENLSLSREVREEGRSPRGLISNVADIPPFFPSLYDEDNSIPGNRYGYNGFEGPDGESPPANVSSPNDLARYNLTDYELQTLRLLGGVDAEITFFEGFSFKSEASVDYRNLRKNSFQFAYTDAEVGVEGRDNLLSKNRLDRSTLVFTNQLRYDNDLGDHSVEALALAEQQLIRNANIGARQGALQSSVENFRVFTEASGTSGGFEQNLVGFLGRLKYDYANKYLITASVRRDGTSTFAPGNRWGTFPSVSAGWRIGQEPFMEAVPALTSLKLRGSWGQLGNSASVGPYSYLSTINTCCGTYSVGDESFFTSDPTGNGFVNKELSWETVETVDFGLRAGLFDDRLTFGATYYRRDTNDLLYNVAISNVSGFGSAPVNLGNVRNTGVELEAGYTDEVGEVTFNIDGNLTTTNNELTRLREGIDVFARGIYRTEVGQPIGSFFGYKTDGIINTQQELEDARALEDDLANAEPQMGDVKFVDLATPCTSANTGPDLPCEEGQRILREPDGEITGADRTFIGKTIPDLTYGFNFDINWRQFDFGVFFQGETGVQRYNQFRRFNLGLGGGGNNQLAASQDRYSEDNPDGDLPRAVATDPNNNTRFSDLWVEDAGYLRLKNVQLGYSIPPSLASGAFQQARLYVSVSNVFTLTPYEGLSPTARAYDPTGIQNGQVNNQLRAGTDTGLLGMPRTYRVGIQLQL
jgi:TonB-linked SusC/RagA family outer membrane protein